MFALSSVMSTHLRHLAYLSEAQLNQVHEAQRKDRECVEHGHYEMLGLLHNFGTPLWDPTGTLQVPFEKYVELLEPRRLQKLKRQMARKAHPDKCPDNISAADAVAAVAAAANDRMARINVAFGALVALGELLQEISGWAISTTTPVDNRHSAGSATHGGSNGSNGSDGPHDKCSLHFSFEQGCAAVAAVFNALKQPVELSYQLSCHYRYNDNATSSSLGSRSNGVGLSVLTLSQLDAVQQIVGPAPMLLGIGATMRIANAMMAHGLAVCLEPAAPGKLPIYASTSKLRVARGQRFDMFVRAVMEMIIVQRT